MGNTNPFLTKALTALGAVALVVSLGFSGVTYISKRALETQNKVQADKLAKLDGENKRLGRLNSDDEAKLKSLSDQLARLLPEDSTLKDDMGAFAQQAAACEKIRQTLKLGA
jgi:hypothetical protein